MYDEVHANRVLYKGGPKPGNRYRQIVVVEKGTQQFELRVFEDDVVQTDPKFIAQSAAPEVYFHSTLNAALSDLEKRFQESVGAGWEPFNPHFPTGA